MALEVGKRGNELNCVENCVLIIVLATRNGRHQMRDVLEVVLGRGSIFLLPKGCSEISLDIFCLLFCFFWGLISISSASNL